jgi:hypothetical protein
MARSEAMCQYACRGLGLKGGCRSFIILECKNLQANPSHFSRQGISKALDGEDNRTRMRLHNTKVFSPACTIFRIICTLPRCARISVTRLSRHHGRLSITTGPCEYKAVMCHCSIVLQLIVRLPLDKRRSLNIYSNNPTSRFIDQMVGVGLHSILS